jgi:hypothetical protein
VVHLSLRFCFPDAGTDRAFWHISEKEKAMKTLFKTVIGASLMLALSCGLVFGAEKAAAANSSILIISTHMVPPNPNGVTFQSPWITVLSTQIKPPGGKDLFIGFSAQTLLADTSFQLGFGTPASFTFTQELNEIDARVLVDGIPAAPGPIAFDGLFRSLSAELANPITSCREVAETGPLAGVVTCTFGFDFLSQLIATAGARSFNFIMRDVSPDNHVVVAQVRFTANNFHSPNAPADSSTTTAVVGARTLTVEQVALDPQ